MFNSDLRAHLELLDVDLKRRIREADQQEQWIRTLEAQVLALYKELGYEWVPARHIRGHLQKVEKS